MNLLLAKSYFNELGCCIIKEKKIKCDNCLHKENQLNTALKIFKLDKKNLDYKYFFDLKGYDLFGYYTNKCTLLEFINNICKEKWLNEFYDYDKLIDNYNLELLKYNNYHKIETDKDMLTFIYKFEKTINYPIVWPWIKKHYAIKIIQRNCHNWLWKPICKDGTIGINPRLSLKKLNKKKQKAD